MSEPMRHANDPEIRALLRPHVQSGDPTARIVDEVAIGYSRIDMLAIGEMLTGYEIKSWNDTLKKLPQQAMSYSVILHRCALVATPRHMDTAAKLVPEWWGLLLVVQNEDGVTFAPLREMGQNPRVDVKRCALLLWREELRAILTANGVVRGHASKSKIQLAQMVHDCAPLPVVYSAIARTLRERPEWRDENGRAINRFTQVQATA